jgi:hypothetical protein
MWERYGRTTWSGGAHDPKLILTNKCIYTGASHSSYSASLGTIHSSATGHIKGESNASLSPDNAHARV